MFYCVFTHKLVSSRRPSARERCRYLEELVPSANSLTLRVLGRFIYSECPRIPATWMPGKKLILNYQKPHIALSLSSKIQCVEFSWLCSSAPAFRSRGRSYMLRAFYLQSVMVVWVIFKSRFSSKLDVPQKQHRMWWWWLWNGQAASITYFTSIHIILAQEDSCLLAQEDSCY